MIQNWFGLIWINPKDQNIGKSKKNKKPQKKMNLGSSHVQTVFPLEKACAWTTKKILQIM